MNGGPGGPLFRASPGRARPAQLPRVALAPSVAPGTRETGEASQREPGARWRIRGLGVDQRGGAAAGCEERCSRVLGAARWRDASGIGRRRGVGEFVRVEVADQIATIRL